MQPISPCVTLFHHGRLSMVIPMTLEDKIILESRRLGFATTGFAAAGPAETLEIYRQWLDSGRAAGMDYLERHADLRSRLQQVAPGAQSVIVVAARYPVNPTPEKGISSYAGGRDYHGVLRRKLKQLVLFLQKETELNVARICIDSAPVLEREWAIRAGIGWRGRQGQVINPEIGSTFFLGEILVDLPLKPSLPQTNRCGDCRRCIDACPTGAIDSRGLVDARKCRSYLTIEHHGNIAQEMQPMLGQALFGCDLCTAACPWSRFGDDWVMPEFERKNNLLAEDILALTEDDFLRRFQGTPLYRTGLARLRRNALIARENRENREKNPKDSTVPQEE